MPCSLYDTATMVGENNTFNKLVSEMSSSERKVLYQKLNSSVDSTMDELGESFKDNVILDYDQIDISVRYKSESIFIRLVCFLVALLFGKKKEDVYRTKLLSRLGKDVIKNFPGIYEPHTSLLTGDSYECFNHLAESSSFFRDLLSRYTASRGDFYVVLSSVLVPSFYDMLSSVVDIIDIPFNSDAPTEIRQSLLRRFDNSFSSMCDEDRSVMYNAVRSLEWLRKFSLVLYSRITTRYVPNGRGGFQCRLDQITDELSDCANVLCNPRNISVALLQSLFLFNNQVRIDQNLCDEESEYHAFISAAREYLANIRVFLNKVPILEITRLAVHDCNYLPQQISNGEDWFTAFRNAWKKKLDSQWALWNRRYKKWLVQELICKFLDCETMPVLKYHPWQEVKESLFFRRELSFVFLRSFFDIVYNKQVNNPLKLIMMSGEFYKRENYIAYTEAYNAIDRLDEQLKEFEERLSPKGSIGSVFHEILKDKIITLSNKHRIDSLMMTIDADSAALINETINAINAMRDILSQMVQRDGMAIREIISNLRVIENSSGKQFYHELETSYEALLQLLDIERELETVELES